jgi:hypothetical protein
MGRVGRVSGTERVSRGGWSVVWVGDLEAILWLESSPDTEGHKRRGGTSEKILSPLLQSAGLLPLGVLLLVWGVGERVMGKGGTNLRCTPQSNRKSEGLSHRCETQQKDALSQAGMRKRDREGEALDLELDKALGLELVAGE